MRNPPMPRPVRAGPERAVETGGAQLAEPADARLALEYATAALVAGRGRPRPPASTSYAQMAACDPGQLPALPAHDLGGRARIEDTWDCTPEQPS